MHILFVCPHGAAKSVVATAVAQHIVALRGLAVTCDNAGTHPDLENSRAALDVLARNGQSFTGTPRVATAADVERADVVVSLGVTERELPTLPARFVDWSDVPNASEDAEGLHAVLTERLGQLLE